MNGSRGSATVETVVLAPVIVMVLAFVMGCGRLVQAGMSVRNAADQAARSASMVSAGRMHQVGVAQATRHLTAGNSGCLRPSVDISLQTIRHLPVVRAVARCTVDLNGVMSVFGLPRSVTAVSTEVIDVFTYR